MPDSVHSRTHWLRAERETSIAQFLYMWSQCYSHLTKWEELRKAALNNLVNLGDLGKKRRRTSLGVTLTTRYCIGMLLTIPALFPLYVCQLDHMLPTYQQLGTYYPPNVPFQVPFLIHSKVKWPCMIKVPGRFLEG